MSESSPSSPGVFHVKLSLQIGDKQASGVMEKEVFDKDPEGMVMRYALEALRAIRDLRDVRA